MKKIDIFNKEYSYIKNEKYVENIKILIDNLPDYFFTVQASSTGKYHPEFALGDGGLVRHTKVAVRIAFELLNNNTVFNTFTSDEKDLMICSLLIHDGLKHGINKNDYTVFEHPNLIAEFVINNKDKLSLNEKEIQFISDCVKTHMGEWTKDYRGNEVLERPTTKYQKFVHLCDYLASRKFLNVSFKNMEIEG